jgi:hypothetical protein
MGFLKTTSVAAMAIVGEVALSVPARAAVVLCSSGPGINLTVDRCTAGENDNLGAVEATISAATGVAVAALGLFPLWQERRPSDLVRLQSCRSCKRRFDGLERF